MIELSEQLKQVGLFAHLSKRETELILASSEVLELERGQKLFSPGSPRDAVYLVLSGGIKVHKEGPQSSFILEIYRPGDVLGEEVLLSTEPQDCTALPLDQATVLKIGLSLINQLMESNPRFAREWVALAISRSRAYRAKIEDLLFRNVEARLAQTLLKLARSFGRRDKQGIMIFARITHQDLADYIGASRETVSLTISQMRRKKLLRMNGRKFIIPDLKALRKIAE